MKWKDDVIVKKEQNTYLLIMDGKEKEILPEHVYILEAIKKGMEEDTLLVDYIRKKESICEAAAGFTLAGFIIEYADYVAEDTSHIEII